MTLETLAMYMLHLETLTLGAYCVFQCKMHVKALDMCVLHLETPTLATHSHITSGNPSPG